MRRNKRLKLWFAIAVFVCTAAATAPAVRAGDSEYEKVVKHLKTKYQAKKVKIPFMWLARAAVKTVRPAGVKSFSLTVFENLQFAPATLDAEMRLALSNSFGAEWTPVLRVRSRKGEQVYVHLREAGSSVKMMLVTISDNQATAIRAAFNPEKVAEFVDNPKVFGISLNRDDRKSNDEQSSNR